MKYFFTLICISLLLINPVFSQGNFEGIVTFKIEYQDLNGDIAALEEMLPTQMTIKIKGNKTRTEQNSAMSNTITINNGDKKTSVSLINILEQKIIIIMTQAELEAEKEKSGNDAPPQIEYYDETQEIARYECTKAEVSLEGTSDLATIYFTENIQIDKVGAPYKGLRGFPMQYEITKDGISMIITATSVEIEEISNSEFTIPKDYTKMTLEDFQKNFGAKMDQE